MDSADEKQKVEPYGWYVLAVLFLVYVLNFIDRQILAILADDVKRDLNLTDGDIGFLFGTAFGIFYSVFGIPLGRLADSWRRVRLMSFGLALWSAMTAFSGLARTGGMLTFARIGVGIGEASASPSAYSLISDWFPPRLRATALSIYSSGIYIGGGVSLFIGGLIVEKWNAAYPHGAAPFGLAGWQVAFMAVGLPGILLAILVATLREPLRGQSEGRIQHVEPTARGFIDELITIIPPFSLIGAARAGRPVLLRNIGCMLVIGLVVAILVGVFNEPIAQWAAVGLGVYAVYSWAISLRARDPNTFALTFGSRAFMAVVVAYGLNSFVSYAMSGFAPSYARRIFGVAADEAGLLLGLPGAMAGFVGVTIGGRIADHLRQKHISGRIAVVLFGAIAPAPLVIIAMTTSQPTVFYICAALAMLCSSSALGAAAATTQDIVLPRMRGSATAIFFLGTTLLGLAMGPYIAGRVSHLTGDLGTGLLSLLTTVPIGIAAAVLAWRSLPEAVRRRAEIARIDIGAPPAATAAAVSPRRGSAAGA